MLSEANGFSSWLVPTVSEGSASGLFREGPDGKVLSLTTRMGNTFCPHSGEIRRSLPSVPSLEEARLFRQIRETIMYKVEAVA